MIFYIVDKSKPEQFQFVERFDGTLKGARSAIASDAYPPGTYLILACTSGDVVKKVEKTEKVSVAFKPTRTRKSKKE